MNIGEALKLIRTINGLTQAELADELDLSNTYISELERGNRDPSLSVIKRYADFFEIPVSSIMLFAEEMEGGGKSKRVVSNLLARVLKIAARTKG
jgi:transcriptional regulator with XRE-family HTH domain